MYISVSAVPIDKTLFYDETQLMDSVNMTLKKAKDISGDRIEFFSAEDLNRKISSLELLEELKKSVENDFEVLKYIINLKFVQATMIFME